MAKRDKYTAPRNPQSRSGVEDPASAEETIKGIEKWYETNKNIINGLLVAVVAVFAGLYIYNKFLKTPKIEKANNAIFMAQKYYQKDSLNLALNGDGTSYGFLKVIDKYGSYDAGNLAQHYAGMCYLRKGEFDKAIKHLSKFDGHETIPDALTKGSLGDAYMEKGQKEKAISSYLAASADDGNKLAGPIYLERAALVYELSGKADKAIETFEKLKTTFPDSKQAQNADKYLARLGKY